jgi:hypothetical protein
MSLTTEQLRDAFGLVDTMIDCNARLDGAFDDGWRAHLVSSIVTCSEKIQAYVDTADPSPHQPYDDILPATAHPPVRRPPKSQPGDATRYGPLGRTSVGAQRVLAADSRVGS